MEFKRKATILYTSVVKKAVEGGGLAGILFPFVTFVLFVVKKSLPLMPAGSQATAGANAEC